MTYWHKYKPVGPNSTQPPTRNLKTPKSFLATPVPLSAYLSINCSLSGAKTYSLSAAQVLQWVMLMQWHWSIALAIRPRSRPQRMHVLASKTNRNGWQQVCRDIERVNLTILGLLVIFPIKTTNTLSCFLNTNDDRDVYSEHDCGDVLLLVVGY